MESSTTSTAAAAAAAARQENNDDNHGNHDDKSSDDNEDQQQPLSLRRSKRDVHAIKLGGRSGNQQFLNNLQKLFFNKRILPQEYESILLQGAARRRGNKNNSNGTNNTTNAMQVRRATNRRQVPIYVLDNFLTEAELEYFDEKIQSKLAFQRSFVDNMAYNNDDEEEDSDEDGTDAKSKSKPSRKRKKRTILDDTHRTSTFYPFRKLQDTRVAALEQRIASLLGCWVHQIEPLQLVRYEPGQFFGVHHDMGDLKEDDTVALPPKDLSVKRRLVTIFCYLNTLEDGQGGATYFPKCGNLRVKPKRGTAVLWSNVTEDGQPDERTIHAGEAVIDNRKPTAAAASSDGGAKKGKKGKKQEQPKEDELVKYGLNVWICEE